MTSTLFSLLFSFVPFILIFIYLRMLRKRTLISFYIKSGIRCYSCKDEIITIMDEEYFNSLRKMEEEEKDTYRLCTSCERNRSIDILFSKKRGQIMLELKKFILSSKYDKIQRVIIIGCMALPIIGLIVKYAFGFENHLSDVSNLINTIIWSFMIFQLRATTIPKEK